MNSYNYSTAASRVFYMAHRFLREFDIKWLPVDIIGITQKRWAFKWAHDNAWEIGKSNDYVCKHVMRSYDGITFYDSAIDSYQILLNCLENKNGEMSRRVIWNCAHEVGHIYLGHLKDNCVPYLTDGNISPERYAQLEFEADLFAGEILASKWLMRDIDIVDESDIGMICNISDPAALTRYQKATIDYNIVQVNAILTRHAFAEYLKEITVCTNSAGLAQGVIGDVSRFCSQNKSKNKLPSPKPKFLRRHGNCPYCDNNYNYEDNPNFCESCGSQLRPTDEFILSPCGHKNHKDAAYCPKCGNRVYRIRQGFWLEECEI